MPHKQRVAGTIPLDIVVGKFNFLDNVNVNVNMRVSFFWQGGNVTFGLEEQGVIQQWACDNTTPVCKKVYRSRIDTRPDSKAWYLPDGLIKAWVWGTVRLNDGVTSRWLDTRLESWFVLANNVDTDITGKTLPPAALTRTFIPWKNTYVAMNSDLPLGSVTGNFTFKSRHYLTGNTGANLTGIFVAVDPQLAVKPTPDLGYVIRNTGSSPQGTPLAVAPTGCTLNANGDGVPLTCNTLTLNPSVVPKFCPLNPCDNGLCDGLHRLVLRSDFLVSPSNPIFQGLPPDGQVGAGTLSTVLVVPIVTVNNIIKNPSACPSAAAPASALAMAPRSSAVSLVHEDVADAAVSFAAPAAANSPVVETVTKLIPTEDF